MVVSFRSVGFFLFICWHQRLIRGLCVSQVHSERIGLLIVLLFFCLQKLESGRRLGGEMCWWMAFSALKLSNPVTSFFFRAGGEGRGGGKWEETNCFSSSQNDSSFWDSFENSWRWNSIRSLSPEFISCYKITSQLNELNCEWNQLERRKRRSPQHQHRCGSHCENS